MSLQICPKCWKENWFWKIYYTINFSRFKKLGIVIKCDFCKNKEKIWHKKWCSWKNIFYWFLWMLPAIVLIYLVATSCINYFYAILLITAFHFISMYFIIKLWKYEKNM